MERKRIGIYLQEAAKEARHAGVLMILRTGIAAAVVVEAALLNDYSRSIGEVEFESKVFSYNASLPENAHLDLSRYEEIQEKKEDADFKRQLAGAGLISTIVSIGSLVLVERDIRKAKNSSHPRGGGEALRAERSQKQQEQLPQQHTGEEKVLFPRETTA